MMYQEDEALTPLPRRRPTRTKTLPETMKFCNDPIHAVAVEALCCMDEWQPCEGFSLAYHRNYGDADITIGLPLSADTKNLQVLKEACKENLIKGHFVLWAHYYAEVDGQMQPYIELSIPQFCSDVGYKRSPKGGFRLQFKQRALATLLALSALEIRAIKTFKDKTPNGKKIKLTGSLWTRGIIGEQLEEDSAVQDSNAQDLCNGTDNCVLSQGGKRWEPVMFTFMPGQWFLHPDWRKYHKFLGKVSVGLTQLQNNTDEWAIAIGGYLAVQMRTNQYRPLRRRIGAILQHSGLAQSERAKGKTSELRDKLFTALDKLVSVGIIKSWRLEGMDISEVDMDDPDAIAAYGEADPYPPGDWRNHIIEIITPFEDESQRIKSSQAKATAKRRRESALPENAVSHS